VAGRQSWRKIVASGLRDCISGCNMRGTPPLTESYVLFLAVT
jgi:hypothetical protein